MPAEVKVKKGDCLSRIAVKHGFTVDFLWHHNLNTALRKKRKSPHILQVGDIVYIPDKTDKTIDAQTEKRSSYVRAHTTATLKARIHINGSPVVGSAFILSAKGGFIEGNTDSDGLIDIQIPADEKKVKLTFKGRKNPLEFEIDLGSLSPADTVSGVQQRLRNLGYYFGNIDNQLNETLQRALESFQAEHKLTISRQIDLQTEQKLTEIYGC